MQGVAASSATIAGGIVIEMSSEGVSPIEEEEWIADVEMDRLREEEVEQQANTGQG